MIIAQVWIRIFRINLPTVTLWSVGNHRVHGDFENIYAFETCLGSHANNQKTKSTVKGHGHKDVEP